MEYAKRCTDHADVLVKNFPSGSRWMCYACSDEWRVEQDEAAAAFKRDTRGVDYGR
jgi:hypothetical protein